MRGKGRIGREKRGREKEGEEKRKERWREETGEGEEREEEQEEAQLLPKPFNLKCSDCFNKWIYKSLVMEYLIPLLPYTFVELQLPGNQ